VTGDDRISAMRRQILSSVGELPTVELNGRRQSRGRPQSISLNAVVKGIGVLLCSSIAACGGSRSQPQESITPSGSASSATNSNSAAVGLTDSTTLAARMKLISAGCPGGNGVHISVNSGTTTSSSASSGAGAGITTADTGTSRPDTSISKPDTGANVKSDSTSMLNININEKNSIDTTIVFNVAQKSWTRTNLAAAITAGLTDQAHGGYAICAGVTANMPSATLTVNGARGRVHFAASIQNLLNAIRSGPGL
jgi:hypothetical protein